MAAAVAASVSTTTTGNIIKSMASTKTKARSKVHQRDMNNNTSPNKKSNGGTSGNAGAQGNSSSSSIDPSLYISLLQNFDDEAALRRRALQEAIASAEKQLIARLEEEIPVLLDMLGDMTVRQFAEVYNYDVNAAYEATISGRVADLDEDINRTIRKRKRMAGGGGGAMDSASNADENEAHASPLKPRKNMRMAGPPTPKMASHTHTLPRSASRPFASSSNNTASRAAAFSGNINSNAARTASLRGKSMSSAAAASVGVAPSSLSSRYSTASSSNAGNFIYKARPSMTVPTNFNGPRAPQTPKTGAAANSTAGSKSTAKRLPRRNESIQAYSINGSPLGLFDLAIEQADHGHQQPQQQQTSGRQSEGESGTEEDWEVLTNRTTASTSAAAAAAAHPGIGYPASRARTMSSSTMPPSTVQSQVQAAIASSSQSQTQTSAPGTPLGKVSPSKLARKASHSAFKNKILAGASKAFGGGHGHGQGNGNGTSGSRFASPTKSSLAMAAGNGWSSQHSQPGLTRPPSRDEFTFSAHPPLPSIPSQSSVLDQWEAMKKDLARIVPDPEQRKVFEQRYFEVMQSGK